MKSRVPLMRRLPLGCLMDSIYFRRARTLVVVSHRPATILWADRILVVEEGAIVDSGKHPELLVRCEAYRRIWQSQDDETPSMSLQAVDGIGSRVGMQGPAS